MCRLREEIDILSRELELHLEATKYHVERAKHILKQILIQTGNVKIEPTAPVNEECSRCEL